MDTAPQVSTAPSNDSSPTVSSAAEQSSASDYLKELQSMKGEVATLRKEKDSLSSRFEKASKAFSGEPEAGQEGDPDEAFLNMYLEEALEDQKRGGKGLPLTTKLAMENVAVKKELREMKKMVEALKGRQEFEGSPEAKYDRDAYSQLDMQVQDALADIYGEGQPHLFDAVTKQLAAEIKSIKAKSPETWNQIRRNPEYLKRLGMHFVEQAIPPKARQMLNAEKERNTPMHMSELRQAMKEADDIRDPQARTQIKEQIRQKLLEEMYNRQ
jgi:hypothetical protein